jgi:hypothetical protein
MGELKRVAELLKPIQDNVSHETLARAAWRNAVGSKIAAHTRVTRLVRGKLIVEVEDQIWKHQLEKLQHSILQNLSKVGAEIDGLEFRPMPARAFRNARVPAVADPPYKSKIGDAAILQAAEDVASEADFVADPVLRALYKEAKRA